MGKTRTIYSVHPAVTHGQRILANLPAKTGRSLEQWVALVSADGPAEDQDRRAWMKSMHGIGGVTAKLVVDHAAGRSTDTDPDAYLAAAESMVTAMYSGAKEVLKPIYERLIEVSLRLGDELRISPCKTIVPLYRNHVFAEIKPATRSRVDFGLALKGCEHVLPDRLLRTGGLERGDRITHRFPLSHQCEVDDQVVDWMKVAFALDA